MIEDDDLAGLDMTATERAQLNFMVYVEIDSLDNFLTPITGAASVVGGAALIITTPDGGHVGYPLARVLSWAQAIEEQP